MSRAGGRRAITRTNTRRAGVLGVVVVGLTFGMLTLSGTTPLGIGRSVDKPSVVSLSTRTFSCTGGIAGTSTLSGDVETGVSAPRTVTTTPATITVDRDLARDAFAGQQAQSGKGYAWLPCPEARSRWWLVGAGAAVTHDSALTLTNPRTGPAVVDVSVYGPDGVVASPSLKGITIAGGGVRTFDLARTAPANGDLAVSVIASRGLVAVSAADKFSPGEIRKPVSEWLPAQTLPSRDLTLAGTPAKPGSANLLVVNPGKVDAIVKIEVIGSTGTFQPTSVPPLTIGPQSVASVPMATVFNGSAMAVRLTSDQPVTATVRSVVSGDTAYATGVRPIRGTTAFAVPPGAGTLVLSSLRTGGSIRVLGYDSTAHRLVEKTVSVKAETSVALPITSKMRYFELIGDQPDIVAGFWVAGAKGIVSAGVTSSIRSIRLPQVRPDS